MKKPKQPRKSARPDEPDAPNGHVVPNVDRALAVLEKLAAAPRGLALGEIATDLRLPPSSAWRILMTLLGRGFVRRDGDARRFTLTGKLLALGHAATGDRNLVELALDVMREVRDAVGETVLLGTLREGAAIALAQVPGSHPFKFVVDPGMTMTLHTAAPAKAMLAFLPEREREGLLRGMTLTRYNERTIASREAFREELARIRKAGYALDRAEQFEGVHCVAAAIRDAHGYPLATVWITGPATRMPEASLAQLGTTIRGAARRIEAALGIEN
jgi:DNA-binding IclR family transcriptional regulator